MSGAQFLHCRECAEIFRPTPYDRAPEFHVTPDGGSTQVRRDDCMAFLARHARHRLETLRPAGDLRAHEGPLWDPLAATYWQVSNGTEVLLVKGSRERITDPVRYELVPGRIVAEPSTVEIPEDEIRTDIDAALYPGVAAQRRLDGFITAFRAVVGTLDPARLEIVYDVPSDPTLSVAKLPADLIDELVRRVRALFDAADAARIEARLRASAHEYDAFTVLVRQRVRIEP